MAKSRKGGLLLWAVLAAGAAPAQNTAAGPAERQTVAVPPIFVPGNGFMSGSAFAATQMPIGPPVTGKPASILRESRSVFRNFDGTSTTTLDAILWQRDSQGRSRTEIDRQHGGITEVVSIIIVDPVRQQYLVLDASRRLAQVVQAPAPGTGIPAPDPHPHEGQPLPPKNILGVLAEGTRTSKMVKFPAGPQGKLIDINLTTEVWRSKDFALDLQAEYTYGGGVGEVKVKTLTLSQAEPDPALFTAPEGYSVTPGSR